MQSMALSGATSRLLEIDFFASGKPRSAGDRKTKIEVFVPDARKRESFLAYGHHYYDDPDYGVGYGGYHYDGRYGQCAERMIDHYRLAAGSAVLEMGCAKGFVLVEFFRRGMNVAGIDISSYAVEHAVPEIKPFIVNASCDRLPWPDNSFDLVYSKETLPHLTEQQVVAAISEARRVCRSDNIFFEIQVGNDAEAQRLIKAWDETHKTVHSADWWHRLLRDLGFRGQVNFKVLF
jgi:SAM-dependent methyltransferase